MTDKITDMTLDELGVEARQIGKELESAIQAINVRMDRLMDNAKASGIAAPIVAGFIQAAFNDAQKTLIETALKTLKEK